MIRKIFPHLTWKMIGTQLFLIAALTFFAFFISTFFWMSLFESGVSADVSELISVGYIGAQIGLRLAAPYVLFILFPWVLFLLNMKNYNPKMWIIPSSIVGILYGYIISQFLTEMGGIVFPIFMVTALLLCIFVWLANYMLARLSQINAILVQGKENAPN